MTYEAGGGVELAEVLDYIDPAGLDYSAWVEVGMALKEGGYPCELWDDWSRRDAARYHSGDCAKKWPTFRGAPNPVTVGSIVQMAKDNGWRPAGHEFGWDDPIGGCDGKTLLQPGWVEAREVREPGDDWKPESELIRYIDTLFSDSENVGYVVETWDNDGRRVPTSGCWDRTAGQLKDALRRCHGDLGAVLGDPNPEAGAWIRFNPLDGKGCKNENVIDFRYALVESDSTDIAQQNAIIRELELPVACLVHSGKKSLHAIVRVDAPDYEEYRRRVEFLYEVCRKNGLQPDRQNKNPSRLSRMPGVMRAGRKQFLVDTNIGKATWDEWREWFEATSDNLPDPEPLAAAWDNLPPLAEPLIEGVLRRGHKMLIAGPSKAGKSFALIELCIALAEGGRWLGWQCAQGRVLYVNLELDRASCLHRFRDVYEALGWPPNNIGSIDIWNLRGSSVPMDKLAPKLIRRASRKGYIAVVIDPIYKVLTGDENSADQMAAFCNQFDKVCHELGAAVIYCHHHSKGYQAGKRSMDRASGSGVFARDPDAMLDMVQLELTGPCMEQVQNRAVCDAMERWMDAHVDGWRRDIGPDDRLSERSFTAQAKELLPAERFRQLVAAAESGRARAKSRSAWRIDGTLREFAKFPPVNVWFDYPVHRGDASGALADLAEEGETPTWKKNFAQKKNQEERKKEREDALDIAFNALNFDGEINIKELAEYMGISEKTARRRVKDHSGYWVDDGVVGRKNKGTDT